MEQAQNGSDFFRQFRIRLGSTAFAVEFDSGFLSPGKITRSIHNHGSIELIAVKSGCSVVEAGSKRFEVNCGESLLIPAGMYHCGRMGDTSCERLCFRLHILRRNYNSEVQPLIGLLDSMREAIRVRDPAIPVLLEQIRQEFFMPAAATEGEWIIEGLLTACFAHLLRYAANESGHPRSVDQEDGFRQSDGKRRPGTGKKIDLFFAKRYMHDVTIGDLAEELHFSKTQINRILRTEFKQSFREKLRVTRMQEAKTLLQRLDVRVEDIAAEVGYASISGFYSAFRRVFGMTPLEYRILYREKNENPQECRLDPT